MIRSLYYLFFGRRKKVVLFSSFNGQYNDNPKYISEKLHDLDSSVDIFWVKSPKSHEDFPPYVHTIELYSKKYMELIYTAQVVVDNINGTRSGICLKKSIWENIKLYVINIKKKGQLNISTWHGTPLKKIAMDEPNAAQLYNYYCSSNFILSGCKYTSERLQHAFQNKVIVREYGTPRNDILINNPIAKNEIKKKLDLPLSKKIILYAPTFRNNIEDSGVKQMRALNFEGLHQVLKEKFGGEWAFVYRVHNLVQMKIEFINYENVGMEIINGNLHDDMAEYLYSADILLTDYSGSMFDFALTKRPCFLLTPDINYYETNERGFYMDKSDLPYAINKNCNELIESIRNFTIHVYEKKIEKFLKFIGNFEKGVASEIVAKEILKFLNK